MIPSVYINLEDDVAKAVARIKKEKASSLVLVCPKRCQLFSDSINLRLLKKQVDLLHKEVFILTMDEKGQLYAQEAGFSLKFLPKISGNAGVSDVRTSTLNRGKTATAKRLLPLVSKKTTTGGIKKAAPSIVVTHRSRDLDLQPAVIRRSQKPEEIFDEIPVGPREQKTSKRVRRMLTSVVAMSLIVVLVIVFIVLPKAEVLVYARSEPVTRDWEIGIATKTTLPDADRLQMPAVKISEELSSSKTFQSQGKKEVGNKSSGTVRIYNFTRAPLNLKAQTTTLNIGNKTYVLAEDVVGLRPTEYSDERTKEIDPASLSEPVEVIATAGGEGYNAPAGTRMEITNQVFGSKPQFLYAKTETALSGGTSRYLSLVSDQDVQDAQTQLAETILNDLRTKLKAKEQVLLDKSYIVEPVSFSTDKTAGTESPSFVANLTVRVSGLAFSNAQLKALISERISRTLDSSKTLDFSDNNQMTIKLKGAVDLQNENAALSVHFEGKAVYSLDLDGVAQKLRGKSKSQANEILSSRPEIERIDIVLAPSWQDNFPWFSNKITVKSGNTQ